MRKTLFKKNTRQWEIDFLRGSAVILMIFYHFIYDLINIAEIPSFVVPSFWRLGPEVIAGMFLLTSGLSSFKQMILKNKSPWEVSWKKSKKVLLYGTLLTLVTLIFTSDTIILFGILQCIGISILLGTFFLTTQPRKLIILAISTLIIGWELEHLGYYNISSQWVSHNLAGGRKMLDFFPMLPWFGYYLLGIFWGKTNFSKFCNRFQKRQAYSPILFLGRHSLWMYLVHQPILILILYILGVIA